MKTNYFLITLVLMAGSIFSCNDEVTVSPEETVNLESEMENVAEIKQVIQQAQVISRGGNDSFLNGRVNDIIEGGRLSEGDSIDCDSDFWGIETCADITMIIKPGNAIAVILDFGDGCEYNGLTISGILVNTYFEQDGNFAYHVNFNNFRVDGTTINGESFALWTSEGPAEEHELNFVAAHTEDYLVILENGESFEYQSEFVAAENDEAFAVLEGKVDASNSLGDEFSYDILEPVIVKYTCVMAGTFIPVDGLESYQYNEKEFTVDFGDGACDNIYIIRKGEVTITVDLGENWGDEDDIANSVG